jgi:hypothetical protein
MLMVETSILSFQVIFSQQELEHRVFNPYSLTATAGFDSKGACQKCH